MNILHIGCSFFPKNYLWDKLRQIIEKRVNQNAPGANELDVVYNIIKGVDYCNDLLLIVQLINLSDQSIFAYLLGTMRTSAGQRDVELHKAAKVQREPLFG